MQFKNDSCPLRFQHTLHGDGGRGLDAQRLHQVLMHTLKGFTTSSSQTAKLPEYWEVTYVDDVEILHFDSNSRKTKAKLDWVDNITAKDPEFWKRENENNIVNEQVSKVNIEIAKEHFNHTGGVHLIQRMYGCEWDEETGEVDGWEHYSYDSEDFISFEPRTTRWIAAHPQASITKNKLDQVGLNEHKKYSLTEICPFFLKNHVINGQDFLMRTELPTVSLLQKTPSSPVTCHATGFYPATSALFWRKDDEELHEDVEMVQLLPNHDGTFQTTAHLRVEVTPDAEGEYECVFQLAGVKEAVVVKLDSRSILSNKEEGISIVTSYPQKSPVCLSVHEKETLPEYQCKLDDLYMLKEKEVPL
uniref:Ig-like domain-containing protein n=1 Tax=Hippocampus comes TaxID=109280 RepID=A0A3Q3D6L9_HIPCM